MTDIKAVMMRACDRDQAQAWLDVVDELLKINPEPVQPADWGCLTGHPAIEAQIARQVSAAEPVAWLIESPKEGTLYRAVYLHNAIGDFRGANPNATSTPLYAAQTETESDKVADLTNRLQDAYQSIGNLERNIAALETIIVRSLFYPTDAKDQT